MRSSSPWWFVVTLDALVLGYLCIAMYQAHRTPDTFTPTFMKTFFGLLLPTLVAFFFLRRRLVREKAA
ncbi:MAG: hypothetical protein WHT64_04735 [Desulfomicrobiaceae bacterium]|jgi:hypothetical protein